MPNQDYFDVREDIKMAQCDLSLSFPSCKSEERLCKLAYTSWCPTCDKESPRRRSKSETNEPCRKKGREMKGMIKKCEWNPECENMELDYESRDFRLDATSYRIRSNLCELPTTYITNNCQMMKLSNCQSDFVDGLEKGVKCYENNLKSSEYNNQIPNFGGIMDSRQDRISKLFPKIEESAKNINGMVNKLCPKLDFAKPRLHPTSPNAVHYVYDYNKKLLNGMKHGAKAPEGVKTKVNGTSIIITPLSDFQDPNDVAYSTNRARNEGHGHGDSRLNRNLHLRPSPSPSFTRSQEVFDLKFNGNNGSNNIQYETCTFFDKRVDVPNLKERYLQEVEHLKEKLKALKNTNGCDNLLPVKSFSAPINRDASLKFPGLPMMSRNNIELNEERVTKPIQCDTDNIKQDDSLVNIPSSLTQSKRDRFKSTSKVSLKTKGKFAPVKLRKQRLKASDSVAVNLDVSSSECSGSEDSDGEGNPEEYESSTSSSAREGSSSSGIKCGAGDAINWPLRYSLFPNIPPYLCFISHDALDAQIVSTGSRYLKWKMSTITPILVRRTLTNSGLRLVRSEFSRESNEWIGTWGKHMKSPMFRTLKDSQKLNHFPGTFQLGRKDRLWRNLQRLMLKFGEKEFGFTPQTYVLPQDLKLLKQDWQNKSGDGNEKYIIKPPASARGTGIKVINRWSQLPKRMSLVVQEYISNPYLINGSKFDLRLYVLVTSFNPLRIYLYPDGLARFASVPYSDDVRDLKDRYMHLTNYSINKMSSLYTVNEDANACKGHKWTLSTLWEYLENKGVNTKTLWRNLQQLVIKTIISGESTIVPLCRENMNSRYNCYELFGVDVLLDESLKAWLLEVNISPSLHSQSPLDEHVKGPLVKTLFNLAQFHLPPRLGKVHSRVSPPCLDSRIYTTTLTKKERNKHNYFSQTEIRSEYLEEILVDLTGDDVRHLTQSEDEHAAIGQFEKIFPTARTHHYLEYLDVRYYNRLFDAWECKYERSRHKGIEVLKSLCEQRLHLKIAPPPVFTQSGQNLIPGECNLQPSKEGQTELVTVTLPPTPSIIPNISNPTSLFSDYNRPNTSLLTNKSPLDIQSLYNALRLQSAKRNMALEPFPHSDYSTHV